MKKTRRKSILRTIRGSLNRYLSIVCIVALGAGFLAGLYATTPDMYAAADRYMDDNSWYDINVKATQGFTGEDAQAVGALPGAMAVQPARVLDMVLGTETQGNYTSRVFAILDAAGSTQINGFDLLTGRLPQTPSECVIQLTSGGYVADAPQIGDTLVISTENKNYDDLLAYTLQDALTVVGTVQSPMFISIEPEPSQIGTGGIGLGVFVPEGYCTLPFYTDLYVVTEGTKALDTFSDAYDAAVRSVVGEIEQIADGRARMRAQSVREELLSPIETMEAQLDGLAPIREVSSALYQDDQRRLVQTMQVAATAQAKQGALADALYAGLVSTATAVGDTLKAVPAEGDWLADGRAALAQARGEVLNTEAGWWITRTRADTTGFASYQSNVEKVAALCKVFPVFFFLVAMLVVLTTMTRLVDENRARSGTLKALGFSNGQVLVEYLFYSLTASIIGCIIGFAVGFKVFPSVISSAYGMMYLLPKVQTPYRLNIMAAVSAVTIGGIVLTTISACYAQLRANPASLMMPKAPAPGKRIWLERIPWLWKRLSFTRKVTFRNLFRYKKRLLMTLIGVAGCSALLVTGFGLRDSINDIVDKQFGEIYRYDLTVVLNGGGALQKDPQLQALLSNADSVAGYMPYASETGRVYADNLSEPVSIGVPQDASGFEEYVVLRNRKTHASIPFDDTGVILSEKLCEALKVNVGDAVTVENTQGKKAQFTVSGITENYITAFAYMTPALYQEAYGALPEYASLLCRLQADADADALIERILHSSEVLYARSSHSIKATFADSVKSIDMIVYVLIASAGILSMVVLYNLTNVNICERKKELATIRVLGFYDREVEQYIFRETNLLSIGGTLLGLVGGIWLHNFVVKTVEVNAVMFGRTIYPLSFLYAFLISMAFTFLVNQLMRRSIRSIDMVESMKAND